MTDFLGSFLYSKYLEISLALRKYTWIFYWISIIKDPYHGEKLSCITECTQGFTLKWSTDLSWYFRESAGFMWDTAETELSGRDAFAYFFLGAFLLQWFELPVLVFVDDYPASLNISHCLVNKNKNFSSSSCTDQTIQSGFSCLLW